MKRAVPYLFFNGNCREAMAFCQRCFGGELQLLTYGEGPEGACPDGAQPDTDEIMHACLTKGDFCLMASDWPQSGAKPGNNVHLNLECETMAEIEKLFADLSDGGTVVQPLQDAFWGSRFGMLIDRFGTHWMLNHPLNG